MIFAQLGAVLALAGCSQAFLIPPTISSADIDVIKVLPFEDAVRTPDRIMEIRCPGCPPADSILQLNFSVSHNVGADQLLLDGVQLYPIDPRSQSFMEPLTVSQMIRSADGTWKYGAKTKLGYSLGIKRRPATSSQDNLDLVFMHLEIVEVADKFITGLPAVDLQLLETPSGKLMIGGFKAPARLSNPTENDRECTTLICKWRAIMAAHLSTLKKGCGSKRPTPEVRPVFIPRPHHINKHPQHPGYSRPRPHGSHRWGHNHRHTPASRFLRGLLLHVLVPVFLGITVGLAASLVGMLVGNIVIFTWRLLFRRGQNKYTQVSQEAEADVKVDSKDSLEPQGPPPQYEDALDEKKPIV